MSQNEIISTVTELQELKRMKEELEAEMDALTDRIKAHMGDAEQITAGEYKITWKPVTSTRIDTATLRKELPEVWQEYGKTTTTRRFCVA